MDKARQSFYNDNFNRALKWVLNELRNKDEAYDLVAEIFAKILEKFHTIQNPVHYLNSAIFKAIKNHHGSKKRNYHTSLDDLDLNLFVITSDDGSQVMDKIVIEVFNMVMRESDELTREVFKVKILGEMSATEIQTHFSISYNRYISIIDATRKKIIALLKKYE